MAEYQQLSDGRPDGTLIGSAATDKLGRFGATPVAQQTAPSAISTTTLPAAVATATTNGYGFTTTTDGALVLTILGQLVTAVNLLRTAGVNLGDIA